MRFEKVLSEGEEGRPTTLKIGLFKASAGKFRFALKFQPLFLFYLFIPRKFKLWISVEKNVVSTFYYGFLAYPIKKNMND